MTDHRRVVIVGASVAGVRVAQALRTRGFTGSVALVDADEQWPHDRPGVSKDALGGPAGDALRLLTADDLERLDVTLHRGVAATGLDTRRRALRTTAGDREYDDLVLATGSSPRRLPALEGRDNVHYLRTLRDAERLRAGLDAGGRVVVIGGGFIGGEVASAARRRGLPVDMLEASDRLIARAVPPEVSEDLARRHRDHGVDLRVRALVADVDASAARVRAVVLATGETMPGDHFVVGVGAGPDTAWLEDSGVPVGNGIRCDSSLRADGVEGVWAVGDAAEWHNPRYGVRQRVEHWTTAREQAAHVAASIVTGTATPFAAVPYVWSDQHDVRLQHVGDPDLSGVDVEVERWDAGRALYLYRRDGAVVGATGFNAQAPIARIRRDLLASA
ncbi:NAD(P)/FAD-dependent oxidoreductase [Microbacterium sp. RD1]|uniref:NAD(P)/FAD-dependent oxidoreductase n=1 Tax=Microbacterium sp. RD1 TaxID=3457313 RepID=UPI003FA5B3AD